MEALCQPTDSEVRKVLECASLLSSLPKKHGARHPQRLKTLLGGLVVRDGPPSATSKAVEIRPNRGGLWRCTASHFLGKDERLLALWQCGVLAGKDGISAGGCAAHGKAAEDGRSPRRWRDDGQFSPIPGPHGWS